MGRESVEFFTNQLDKIAETLRRVVQHWGTFPYIVCGRPLEGLTNFKLHFISERVEDCVGHGRGRGDSPSRRHHCCDGAQLKQ